MSLENNIIDVDLQVVADLLPETLLHAPLEVGSSVSKAKRHGSVAKCAKWGDEGCGWLIGWIHCDLVVPRVQV